MVFFDHFIVHKDSASVTSFFLLQEWHAQQIASGEAKDNANFQPLGGDWYLTRSSYLLGLHHFIINTFYGDASRLSFLNVLIGTGGNG